MGARDFVRAGMVELLPASSSESATFPLFMATNTGKLRVKWLRYVLLGVAGLGIYHVLTGPSGALNLLRLKREKARMEADLDSLTQRKRDLQVEKARLERDSAYIERVARKDLGMARPDEKVFRFVLPKNGK
jgi:cell division protein FtsB